MALRDTTVVPDDGISPLAVVVTADDDLPAFGSTTDLAMDLSVMRQLAHALDPEAILPDDDGVRDLYETDTGLLVSQRNTGTDPNHIDSNGDLCPDGIELRAGSNPNDDASVPEHVELSLPVPGLGVSGGPMLAIELAGGLSHLRSTSHRRKR